MADFFEKHGIKDEARMSIILNTFMYISKCIKSEKTLTLSSIAQQISLSGLEEYQQAALSMVRSSLEHRSNNSFGEYELISYSENMDGKYRGAYAASFRSPDRSVIYVVYRGTGNGRWYDNGDALANVASEYQKIALRYFDDMMDELSPSEDVRVILTGHSKGGNLAQYVMLTSKHKNSISRCISFDGQGFSPEFLGSINYPDSTSEELCSRMYSICGDNDYVNVLGKKIIPDTNTIYIKTATDLTDMSGAHSIVPDRSSDMEKGLIRYIFNFNTNDFNEQTTRQRELAVCAREINANIMDLPQKEREDICRTLMTLSEQFLGGSNSPRGLNGEMATLDEGVGFITNLYEIIVPLVSHVGSEAGEDIIFKVLVVPNCKNADSSMAKAPISDKISLIMSEPDIMKFYYIGAALAIEGLCDNAEQNAYSVGRAVSSRYSDELGLIIKAQLMAADMIISYIKKAGFLAGIAVMVIKSVLKKYLSLQESAGIINTAKKTEAKKASGGKRSRKGTQKADHIMGDDAAEVIEGFGGDDSIHGWGGDDDIYGGDGDDRLYGKGGRDNIYGESGSDHLVGGEDDDYLNGGSGDDDLHGDDGNDVLFGGIGNDILEGGTGDDTLNGGAGDDRYIFARGFGSDIISDPEGSEVIELRGISAEDLLLASDGSGGLIISVRGTDDSINIEGFRCDRFTLEINGGSYGIVENDGAYFLIKQ